MAQSVFNPQNYEMEFTKYFGMSGLNVSWGFDKTYEEARIMVNDYNVKNNSDFDFNDLVFDAKFTNSGAKITLRAVGTISPIRIGGKEAHEVFGVSTNTLVNTKDISYDAVTFDLEGNFGGNYNTIEVEMQDENGYWHLLQSRRGDATTKLAVPTSVKWCMENEIINKVYPDFNNFVHGNDCNWWENYQGSQSIVETSRTIHVVTAGTLSNYISQDEKYQIEELTLIGEINGEDFRLLRDMAGKGFRCEDRHGLIFPHTDGNLSYLDLSGVKIVKGGCYAEWDDGDMYGVSYYLDNDNEIPPYVFLGCENLTSIRIPESVINIGAEAFTGTTWYGNQPDGLVYIGKMLYGYKGEMPANTSIKIEYGTIGIACSAFGNCNNLVSIEIPSSVTSIGGMRTSRYGQFNYGYFNYGAFYGCTGLTSITIPNSVTYIGNETFEGCSGLTSITIPNSVTSIGDNAFSGCTGLTSFNIPNSVTSIGTNAFYDCTGLMSILVEAGNSVYDSRDNCNAVIETASNMLMIGCPKTIIPNSVTSIGDNAFSGCTGLTSVIIPNSVTSIGNYAFYKCTGLTSVTIPNSVNSIGGCAFGDCNALKDVYCYAETIPERNYSVFGYSDVSISNANATLHVPANSVDEYKSTSPWSNFKEILPIEGSGNDDPITASQIVGKWEFLWSTPFSSFIMTHVEFKADGSFSYTSIEDPNCEEHGVYKIEDGILYQMFSNEDDWELSRIKYVDSNYLKLIKLTDDGLEEIDELYFLKDNVSDYWLEIAGTWLGAFPYKLGYKTINRYKQWIFNPDGTGSLTERIDDNNITTEDSFRYKVTESTITIDWGDGSPDIYDYMISGVTLTLTRYDKTWNYYWQGETTSIRSIVSENVIEDIYSLSGTKLKSPSKGINIIKLKDGTTKKVLVK